MRRLFRAFVRAVLQRDRRVPASVRTGSKLARGQSQGVQWRAGEAASWPRHVENGKPGFHGARSEAGHALYLAQCGERAINAVPLTGFGGAGRNTTWNLFVLA
jgi:uncharacterized protein YbjT (DUF2867 family)